MNGVEIRAAIDANNKMIQDIMSPNTFILNNVIRDLLNENHKLQELCSHQFEEGFCIFCDKEEEAIELESN